MKKKLLLLLLILLIPFIVKANELENLGIKWTFGEKKEDFAYYEFDNTFVLSSENELTSINKISGETKKVSFDNGSHQMLLNGQKIALVTQDNNKVSLIIYDEYLNQISKKSFEDFEIDFFKVNEIPVTGGTEFYYIISGNKYVNGNYYRIIIFYGEDESLGEHKEEYITYQKTIPFRSKNNNQTFFRDFNGNHYNFVSGYVRPEYFNAVDDDDSYMYLTNDKLYKKSYETGEVIDSLDIPNGKGTRMAKKNNYYYVMTSAYSQDQDDSSKYIITFTIYVIDENLNIIQTFTPDITAETYNEPTEQGFDINLYDIYDFDDYNVQFYVGENYYNISDNEIVQAGSYGTRYEEEHYYTSKNGEYVFKRSGKTYYESDLSNKVEEEASDNIIVKSHRGYKNGTNKTAIVQLYKVDSETNKAYIKYRLITYDNDLNIIYKKDLTDWEEAASEEDLNYTQDIEFKDNNTIVALNYKDKVVLVVLDAEGNIIKDLSSEIANTKHMNVTGILNTYKGFFIKYDSGMYVEFGYKGVSQLVNTKTLVKNQIVTLLKPYVLQEGYWNRNNAYYNELDNYTYLFAFSYNYNIIKQVNGKGTITSTVEKADEGEVVRFTVTPEEGYVLSVVKVTDANGNVLIFTDNTFVMPSSDVIIEATFVPINPKTGNAKVLAVITLFAVSGIIYFLTKKKYSLLK